MARTDDDDWFGELCRELDQPLPRDGGPLARLVWLKDAAASEFILVADHVICDGQSALILLRDLVGRLQRPDARPTDPPGFATLDELFGRVTRRTQLGLHAGALLGGALFWANDLRTRRRRRTARQPSYVLRWDLDETATACLAEHAARERTTTYAALATAFLLAVLAVRPADSLNRLVCPVDPRPFFAVRGTNLLFPIPSQVRLSLDRALDGQFWSQARRLGADLLAGYVRLRPDRMARVAERLHPLVDRVIDAALHGPATNDLAFSHLANADLPSEPDRPAEALASRASRPWAQPTAIRSRASAGSLRCCLTSRETGPARADAERIRDHAVASLVSAQR